MKAVFSGYGGFWEDAVVGDDCINGFFLMLKSVCFFLEHRVVKLR